MTTVPGLSIAEQHTMMRYVPRDGGPSHIVAFTAPARWLNANGRTDRRRQTPDRQQWRDAGAIYAKAGHLPRFERVHILALLRFPNAIRRDPNNWAPTTKAVVDGLVDAGVLADDSSRQIEGPDHRLGDVIRGQVWGQLVLIVTEVGADA